MMDSLIYVESAMILANLFVVRSVGMDFTWNVWASKPCLMRIHGYVKIAKMARFFLKLI
jgi:hypothetical protein